MLQGRLTLTSREPTADKVPSLAQSFQLPASCLCGRESLMSENPMPHSCGVQGACTTGTELPTYRFLDALNNKQLERCHP